MNEQFTLRITTEATGDLETLLAKQNEVIAALRQIGGLSSAVEISFASIVTDEEQLPPNSEIDTTLYEADVEPFDVLEQPIDIAPADLTRLGMPIDQLLNNFSDKENRLPVNKLSGGGVQTVLDALILGADRVTDTPYVGPITTRHIRTALGRVCPSVPFTRKPNATVIAQLCPTLADVTAELVGTRGDMRDYTMQDLLAMPLQKIAEINNLAEFRQSGEPTYKAERVLAAARVFERQFLAEKARIAGVQHPEATP